jgi:hypothetical protein
MEKLKLRLNSLLLFLLYTVTVSIASCKDPVHPEIDKPEENRSGANEIVSFNIDLSQFPGYRQGDKIETVIVSERDSVSVTAPWYVGNLIRPVIETSPNSTISPISGSVRDFSRGALKYTVTAENGAKREWKIYVKWLDEPEPARNDNPRHALEETDKYKIYKIPTYSNAYLETTAFGTSLASGVSLNPNNGISWTMSGTTSRIKILFVVRRHGELQLALRGASGGTDAAPDNTLNVKIKVNGVPAKKEDDGTDYNYNYVYGKRNMSVDTVTIHRVILPEIPSGHVGHTVELDLGVVGPRNGDSYYFRFPELWISGWATTGSGGYNKTGINWVPLSSEHFGRRGPSVHIRPNKPVGDMEYFYSEIFIPEGQDVLNSYFMCNGFDGGYAGIQVNSLNERRVLFSVWNPIAETHPPHPLAGKYAPKLVRINNQPEYRNKFTYTVFSGEGTGGQSRYNAMWPAGRTLKMLTRIRPHPDQEKYPYSSLYKTWFHNGTEWVFVAEWRRQEKLPEDNNGVRPTVKWYSGAHHFLENFGPATGHLTRYGTWNNDWYIGADGAFYESVDYVFTNDATAAAQERVDYAGGILPEGDPQAGAVFLKMGGYFTNNVSAQSKFTKAPKNNRPVIDFEALNAMGTDDPETDKTLTGSNISPIDGSEKYVE